MVQKNGGTEWCICTLLHRKKIKNVPLPLCIPTFFWERGRQTGSGEQQVREHLEKLDIFTLMGLDGSYWGVLARSGRCEATVCHLQKNCAAVWGPQWIKKGSHYPCLWERQKSFCATIGWPASPQGLERSWSIFSFPDIWRTRRQSETVLTHLIAALKEMTCCRGEGEQQRHDSLFSRAFSTVPNRGFIWTLTKNMLDKLTFRWIKNWQLEG